MLVLSRKENERILFPHLGIQIQIVRVDGNRVSVGVDAPSDVKILRGELSLKPGSEPEPDAERQQRHDLRNRLHTASLALHLVQKQLDAGQAGNAEKSLERALHEFAALDQLVAKGGASRGAAAGHSDVPKRRALLVEDSANERELLAGYLRMCGYEVDLAEDGIAAMNYLSHHAPPDFVLLDMQMPYMNGRETLQAIRRNPALGGLKVFIVSGSEPEKVELEGDDRGIERWFAKPLNPQEFVSELNRETAAVG